MEWYLLINIWVDLCVDNIYIDSICLYVWYCFECVINNSDVLMLVIGCILGLILIVFGFIFFNRMFIMFYYNWIKIFYKMLMIDVVYWL